MTARCLPNGYSLESRNIADAESSNGWCGRYFNIRHESKVIKAWVGWLYGVGSYKDSPRFTIQVEKKHFYDLPGASSLGWHLDAFGEQWMNKDLSRELADMNSIARQFRMEIEALCTSE